MMKKLILPSLIILSFFSCVTEKSFYRDFKKEELVGKSPNEKVFIIKKNGEKITGDKLTYSKYSIWKVQQKEDWTAVDGKKVDNKDILVLQKDDKYTKFYQISKTSTSFITRLRQGKICLYTYVESGPMIGTQKDVRGGYHVGTQKDVRGDYHVYVYEKGDGVLRRLYHESFINAIKDNDLAVREFRELFPNEKIKTYNEKGNLKGLLTVVDLYNN